MSRRVWSWAAFSGLVAMAFALACSGSNNGYQTGPGGGGGGGGGGGLELNSGNIAGCGGMFAHTFNTAGTYRYHCSIHTYMTGAVVVKAGAPMAVAVNITNSPFMFAADTVQVNVGGTVTWTNNACSGSPPYQTGTTHTVTTY